MCGIAEASLLSQAMGPARYPCLHIRRANEDIFRKPTFVRLLSGVAKQAAGHDAHFFAACPCRISFALENDSDFPTVFQKPKLQRFPVEDVILTLKRHACVLKSPIQREQPANESIRQATRDACSVPVCMGKARERSFRFDAPRPPFMKKALPAGRFAFSLRPALQRSETKRVKERKRDAQRNEKIGRGSSSGLGRAERTTDGRRLEKKMREAKKAHPGARKSEIKNAARYEARKRKRGGHSFCRFPCSSREKKL